MTRINYSRTDAEPVDFDTMPPGDYTACIVASDRRVSGANADNEYLWLEWQIRGGDYDGRRVWQMLNIWNTNEKARQIAEGEMNAILDAVGVSGVRDSEDLHARDVIITLKVETDKTGQFRPQNRIAKVKPADGASAQAAPPARAVPAAAGGEAPPDDDIPF